MNLVHQKKNQQLSTETSLNFKGWIFKAKPTTPEGIIFNINTDFSTEGTLTSMLSLDALNELTTERVSISGHPQPRVIN
jgi:hypothetical protein